MEVVERKAKGRRAADISCPAVSSRHTSQHPTRPDRVDRFFVGANSIKVKLNSLETLPLCKYIFDTKWMMCFGVCWLRAKGEAGEIPRLGMFTNQKFWSSSSALQHQNQWEPRFLLNLNVSQLEC